MSAIPKTVFFTKKEKQVIDALVRQGSYEKASKYLKTQGLRISPNTMRGMTLRIRNRYSNAKRFSDECEQFQEALQEKSKKLRYFTG